MTIEIASNNTEYFIIAAIEQNLKKEKDDTILEKTITTSITKYITLYLIGERRNIHNTKTRSRESQRYHRISPTLRLKSGPKNIQI